ncbi:MAG: HlyD family efflux transporter periplasmic adaptor subunit [Erysipelotrichales bacterium]|nr:MAG: HlyD family efflux transporter periplasmic adaptor subunit [Erysipelotrichales bacterium]
MLPNSMRSSKRSQNISTKERRKTMNKKNKRRLIWLTVVVVVIAAGLLTFNSIRNNSMARLKKQSTIDDVEKGDLILYSVAKGKITSAETMDTKYEGTLKNNYVAIGDVVAKNFILGQYRDIKQATFNLRSKIAGIVTVLPNAANPMYTIANPDKLQMEVQISEKDIAKIGIGQKAIVFIDAFKLTVDGNVSKISPLGNTTTDFTTYTVTVAFTKGTNPVFLGMTGSAKIETLVKKDVFLVPVEALIENGGKVYILQAGWLDNMNKPQNDYFLEVTVGSAYINHAEISGTGLEGSKAVILPALSTFTGFGGFRNNASTN